MEPKLALAYNSQSGNGLVGVGWNLSGLSAITRCPQTSAQDYAVAAPLRGSIKLALSDRYCLDGQRLIAINGTDGGNGTEYRTERDSFSRIVSYGPVNNGPASFKVWTKSGLLMEYGATADSAIEAQGKTSILIWAVNKVSDVKGNYYSVTYTEDSANGAFYPARIDYTGNTTTGLAPNNSIQFAYETRPDLLLNYTAGSVSRADKRLSAITMFSGATAGFRYALTYAQGPASQRSRLTGLRQCENGTAVSCLPDTVLTWKDTQGFNFTFARALPGASMATNSFLNSYNDIVTGDWNGDGKMDMLHLHPSTDPAASWAALSNGDGTFNFMRSLPGAAAANNSYLSTSDYQIVTGDWNVDGKTDMLHLHPNADPQYSWVALSNGNGTFTFSRSLPGASMATNSFLNSYNDIVTGDWNGDGKIDMLHLHPSTDPAASWVALSNGDGTFNFMRSLPGAAVATNSFLNTGYHTIVTGDWNADGKTDMLHLHPNADPQYSWVALSNGDGTFTFSRLLPGASTATNSFLNADYNDIVTGDWNGDGKMDLLHLHPSADPQYSWVALSNGDGTFTFSRSLPGASMATNSFLNTGYHTIVTGDWNGDGRVDLLHLHPSTDPAASWVALSNGDGTFTFARSLPGASTATNSFLNTGDYQIVTGDWNGDGVTDLLHLHPNADPQYSWVALSGANQPGIVSDQLASITKGLGATTTITYRPLTDVQTYAKGVGATYPVQDLQFPLYVVSSVSSSNGVGGTVSTNYKYGGLKAELGTGRGLLGFNWVESTQVETGLAGRTTYRQDWPYVGLPIQVKKTLAGSGNGGILSQTDFVYACLDPASGSTCSVVAGKRYFPYASQSTERGWDLNGAALPVITTSSSFDIWGNATQVTVSNSDGSSKTNTNTYSNDEANWRLGRLLRSTVTSVTP